MEQQDDAAQAAKSGMVDFTMALVLRARSSIRNLFVALVRVLKSVDEGQDWQGTRAVQYLKRRPCR